ncbi:SPFH domain-containing protein [Paeniglutamicibacter gangotriensis]|uniref:SPFH domain-containing protein n=1 Tax=Paeniglutamicibacter gangotriensis TaxID=254787 RepID=A0A5B0EIW6_9MICC|nr:SPFH domain-containing protein [Paeniglutamicibacter gangotriensis]KAA0978636.1 SPFH domain-containing protein [Paeniglutamicibacter gangotriensis]
MSIIQAFTGALSGTFADQWKDIITAGRFDEQTAVTPGILKQTNAGRGTNYKGSTGVVSNGSKIFVPENTAAFIFSQAGIETIITQAGGYEYQNGQNSIFNGDGVKESFVDQVTARIGFGGQTSDQKQIAFVNLREIRGIKFGTRGPLVYNDLFYGTDLEITAFGTFSLRIANVESFIKNFVPANVFHYSFNSPEARQQLISEFIQSFTVALNSLSSSFRISQLPSQTQTIAAQISNGSIGAGSWAERFGIEVINVGIENVEFTPASRELVKQYSTNRMNLKAYEGVSQQSSNISAQQKIAQGVHDNGLGDGGGMLFGMNLAQGMNSQTGAQVGQAVTLSFDEQIETVKKMKELMDAGLLTEDEFAAKKREIMGL